MKPVSVITGASKGIGFALAQLLHGEGHKVIGLARSKPAEFPGEFIEVDLADTVLPPYNWSGSYVRKRTRERGMLWRGSGIAKARLSTC